MIYAILPAAGHSSRMGRPKLALPFGEHTVLEAVLYQLRLAGIEHILVVLGPHVAEFASLAEKAAANVLVLDEPTADMRATVEHGLRWLEARFHPQSDDQWLLAPADHPAISATLISHLRVTLDASPTHSIALPVHDGKRGHPTLLRWSLVAGIRQLPPGTGLNVYFRQQAAQTLEVLSPSPSVLWEMNTPEEYEQVLKESFAASRAP